METKQCSKCKRELPTTEFRWKNKAAGKLHSQCKDCQRAAEKIHYQESKSRQDAVKETAVFQKNRNIMLVEQYKECGCKKCGEKRPYVLDFHHINPQNKTGVIAHMIKSSSAENLLEELQKCVVLCANCHREFHYLERTEGITFDKYLPS